MQVILPFFNSYAYSRVYRVSQKFVTLISCAITFDQNFIFTSNFYRMFIAPSSTYIQNFSNQRSPFVFLSHSVAVAAWSRKQHVEPQMMYLRFFITFYAGATVYVQKGTISA